MLRSGGVVVTDPRQVVDGRVTVTVSRTTARQDPPSTTATTTTLPGYALRGGLPVDRLILSAAATARLGLVGEPLGYVVDTTGPPTAAQRQRLAADLPRLGPLQIQVEQDAPASDRRPLLLLLAVGSGVITLGAAGVATGLAAAEGRRDLSTLAAVGASPRVRRVLSLCQAGVIAVLGSVLGIVAGLGSALIILASVNRRYAAAWPVADAVPGGGALADPRRAGGGAAGGDARGGAVHPVPAAVERRLELTGAADPVPVRSGGAAAAAAAGRLSRVSVLGTLTRRLGHQQWFGAADAPARPRRPPGRPTHEGPGGSARPGALPGHHHHRPPLRQAPQQPPAVRAGRRRVRGDRARTGGSSTSPAGR